jgi:hypothetical protein
VFLAGFEVEAVEFEEQNADYETGALVAIDERMVADNTGSVKSGHGNDVGTVRVGMVLARTGQGGLQKPSIYGLVHLVLLLDAEVEEVKSLLHALGVK